MQTILGAGGSIGRELAKELRNYTNDIRLVSRNPKKEHPEDQLFPADLTNGEQVLKAVEGSEVVYLTAGLTYSTKIWKQQWPLIMKNVTEACLQHKARLVFFDNIYLYDGVNLNPVKETNVVNPPSEKGKIRAEIVEMLWEAVREKGLVALIARAADFYGPNLDKTSILAETVIKPLSMKKPATILVSDKFKHSYTHTADAAKGTALLGNTLEAFGETWHLPTAKNPLTGREMVELVAAELKSVPKYRVVSKGMIRFMGFFMPLMKEIHEMLYQNDKDYVFNSDKFDAKFGEMARSYEQGIKEIIRNSAN